MASHNVNMSLKTASIRRRPVLLQPELANQSAVLLSAWQRGQLSPAAMKFLAMVKTATMKTGRSKDYQKSTIASLPEALVAKLLSVSAHPQAARQLLAEGFLAQPSTVNRDLQRLVDQKQISAGHAVLIGQAVQASVLRNNVSSLNGILFQLPYKIVQMILNARQATMDAFFKSWSESLALNAKLNKEAALRVQAQALLDAKTRQNASELARQTKKNNQNFNEKANLVLRTQLFNQRSAVFSKASKLFIGHQRVGAKPVITSAASVEDSLAYLEQSGTLAATLVGTEHAAHIATLDALQSPMEDLGPRLGLRRGGGI